MDAGRERYYGAELHFLEGELLAIRPHGDRRRAAASFRAAIAIARERGAKALERREETSLARLSG